MTKLLSSTSPIPLTKEELEGLQTITKDFSPLQLAWISGYFWKQSKITKQCLNIESNHQNIDNKIIVLPSIKLISASQTGNARRLAEQTKEELIAANLNVILVNAGDYKFKNLAQEQFLLLITSTYGLGEPPEEAIPLYKYIFSKKAPNLKNIKFAVFGLGDSSYEHFAKIGKDFDRRLEELGGHRLYLRIDADLNYQKQAEDWRKEIISILQDECKGNIDTKQQIKIINKNCNKVYINSYSKNSPYPAYLLVKQKITSRQSLKDVFHIELDLGNSGLQYQPGDALGVWYENNITLINELLNLTGIQKNESVTICNKSLSITEALQKYYTLTHNTPVIIEKYATLTKDKMLLALSGNQLQLNKFAATTPIIDMIRYAPTKLLSAKQLLSILNFLTPRLYSISSAQAEVGKEVHITVGVIRYKKNGKLITGDCSGYLADQLSLNDQVRIFIESNNNFRLPNDHNASIIMIGAGTGIAPFRAFMQQREYDGASGLSWLFFGNQHLTDDFLYQIEWQQYLKKGILTKIDVAWSRDLSHKVYIQDRIQEKSSEIWHWIQEGAYIYVCGNANLMARAVEQTLMNIIMKKGGMNGEQADEFLDELRISHRYQRDIY